MLFEYDVEVLTSHNINNKYNKIVKLTHGIIHLVSINFPSGCSGLVNITISNGLNQVLPVNPDGTLKGDNCIIHGDVFIPLLHQPYELLITGWNTGTTYDHTITIRLWLKRIWQLMPFSDQMFQLALENDTSMGI